MFGDDVNKIPKTVISKEYSTEWHPGMEPYYPVNDSTNAELYSKYYDRAVNIPNMKFGGRLADFAYYDMDKVVEKVISIFKVQ